MVCRLLFAIFICVLLFSVSNGRPKDIVTAETKQDSPNSPTGQSDTAPETRAANPKLEANVEVQENKPVLQMNIDHGKLADHAETNQQQATLDVKLEQNDEQAKPNGPKNQKTPESTTETTTTPAILNVHDARSRAMAEQMKHVPFKGGDVEEMMHGGHHVHGEEHENNQQPIGVGGAGMAEILDGGTTKEEVTKPPSTEDVEELMHTGDGDHKPHGAEAHEDKHRAAPSADNPEDLLHIGDHEAQAERLKHVSPGAENPEQSLHSQGDHHGEKKAEGHDTDPGHQKAGISVEQVVHGDDHTHDNEAGVMEEYVDEEGNKRKRKLGKEITMEDIKKLRLSDKELEGIDLKKLLRRDRAEYKAWTKDQKDQKEGEKTGGFWDKVDDFSEHYFKMLSKQIRHLSQYRRGEDDQEWEQDDDDDLLPHPGESQVEHESELWASTRTKGNRRKATSFTVIKNDPPHEIADEL